MLDADTVGKSAGYVIALIGADAAAVLFERLGGLELAIPKVCDSKSSEVAALLIDAIGEEAARRIVTACADTRLYIPKANQGRNRGRNQRIRQAYNSGASVNDIALRAGLTSRQVREILGQPDDEAPR